MVWSFAGLALNSKLFVEPVFSVSEPTVLVPTPPLPGERPPPVLMVTAPLTMPFPPSKPPLFITTAPVPVAEPDVLFTARMPPLFVVLPV